MKTPSLSHCTHSSEQGGGSRLSQSHRSPCQQSPALPAGLSSHSRLTAGNREAHRDGLQGYPWVLFHAELPPAPPQPLHCLDTLDTVLDTCASQRHRGIALTSPRTPRPPPGHCQGSRWECKSWCDTASQALCDFPLVSAEDCSITAHLGLDILSSQALVRFSEPQNLRVLLLPLTLLPHPLGLMGRGSGGVCGGTWF